jgi:FkbM family methyltransferase
MRNKAIGDLLKTPGFDPKIIFDVGANVEFVNHFRPERVYAFEPIGAAYQALDMVRVGFPVVETHQLALSDRPGRLEMTSNAASTGNRMLQPGERARGEIEAVTVETGDGFCAAAGVDRIDFLKVDAEGHDLKVLVGFTGMLRDWKVDVLQVECGLSPENDVHVPLDAFTRFLAPLGYRLFGLYGVSRRIHRLPHRRQAMYGDAVYVADPDRLWAAA